jgi:hypothetical protein
MEVFMRTFLTLIIAIFFTIITASLGLAKSCVEIKVGCRCSCSNGAYDDYIGQVTVAAKVYGSNCCQPEGEGKWKVSANKCFDQYGSACKKKCFGNQSISGGYYRFTMYPFIGHATQTAYGSAVGRMTIQFGNKIYQFFNDNQCY